MKNLLTTLLLLLGLTVFAQLDFTDQDPIYEGPQDNNFINIYALSYDLNNDNISDLLHIQNENLYVLYGDGEGYGSEELLYEHTDILSNFSNTLDLNQDGFLDFTLSGKDDKVIVFFGSSEGLTQTILNAPSTYSLLNDFDKDGANDIVYTTQFDIYYLPGNNDGTFDAAVSLTEDISEIQSAYRFSIDDIDGDMDNDLFVLDLSNSELHVLINTDLGLSFSSSIEASGTSFSHGDFNLDGKTDVVVLNTNNDLEVYLNQPTGFTSGFIHDTFNVTNITVVDYNDNGQDDILISNRMTDLTVLTSKGDGTFNDSQDVISNMPRFGNGSLVDFNNDGNRDIVAMGIASNQVILVPLTPQVQMSDQYTYVSLRSDPGSNFSTQVGDLDNDGFKDLVIFSENGVVYVHYGIENGFESSFTQYTSNVFTKAGFLQDINDDGLLDVIVYFQSPDNGTIGTEIMINESARAFSEPSSFKSVFGIFKGIFDDYDKDGSNNFIVSTLSDEIVFLTANQNDSDEYFTGAPTIIENTSFVNDFDLVDINSDGWKDLLVGLRNSNNIEVHLNDQMGGFENPFLIALEAGQAISAVTAADLDDDNIVEIIISGSQKGGIYDRESIMDDFTLATSFTVNSNFGTEYIWVEDFDGDSDLDIFFNDFDNLQYTFAINSDEGWETESDLLESFGQNTIAISDINGDNLMDLVRTKIIEGSIQLTFNNTVFEPTSSNTEIVSITQQNSSSTDIVLNTAEHSGRIVVVKASSEVDGSPTDGTFYAQNSTFGVGAEIGDGNFVVYWGKESEISIDGLSTQTDYHFAVFEYNLNEPKNSIINYKTDVSVPGEFIIKEEQTLNIPSLSYVNFDDGTFEIVVTATSNLPVDLELISGPIELVGNVGTIQDLGTVVIKASQVGNDYYFPVEEEFQFDIIILGLDDEELTLYPNPTSNFLRLRNIERFDSIELMDLNGKSIPLEMTTQGIDVRQLNKGIYVIKIGSKGESRSLKFIKN